ncbi:93_t:CDS:2 [Paraglomus occultum]|uniref:93_t:CDS:1 n=1 Tax=Paraglomus occultum TaxID=144539 RepID=A0A9N8WDP2_9GLOM|nr:93_t:CDS:2 [Paraglomus occultum]
MAFQSIVTGAECSSGANPMTQIMKQFNEDRSLQKVVTNDIGNALPWNQGVCNYVLKALCDAFIPARDSVGPSTFRTVKQELAGENKFANDFFDQRDHGQIVSVDAPHSLHVIENQRHQLAHPEWVTEFDSAITAAEHAKMEEAFKRMNVGASWRAEFENHSHMPALQSVAMPPEFEEAFRKHFDWSSQYALKHDKGKSKIVELDNVSWEEQFAAAQREAEDVQAESFEEELTREDHKLFEEVWSNVRESHLDDPPEPLSWEKEFPEFSEHDESANLGEYVFEPNNPYQGHPDPLNEGIRLVEEGGSLSDAALAFEAAAQKDPNNSEVWTWLGNTQAQNEKEEPAIKALEKAVSIDGKNLNALMNLAVSYTNEGYDYQSYLTLERWMTVKYPEIAERSIPTDIHQNAHSRVTELFLQAARIAPSGQEMDPDVQVGLGVLFYSNSDYDKAVDCFRAALDSRPKDHLLWNRLGATLANSGRSEQAIDAYYKALDLKPTFVRARYNLGVSCINIGCYKEATEHLLGALSMHETIVDKNGGVNVSRSLRDTLRKTFRMMDREDLANKVVADFDINQFRGEFDF